MESESRRRFLHNAAALTGGTLAGGVVATPLELPPAAQTLGRAIPETMYGMPSPHESRVVRRRTDVLKNRQNWSDWSMTPLQDQFGIITPNGLVFERHHADTPDIDPATHRLVVHGLVRQPLMFKMDNK